MNTKAKHPNKRVARSSPTATEQDSFHSLLQSALFGALCGIVVAILLLLAASAICHATNDPASFTGTAGLIALYLSALVAGFAALRRHRSMALACGALSGIFLMLVFLLPCSSFLLVTLQDQVQKSPAPCSFNGLPPTPHQTTLIGHTLLCTFQHF